MPARQSPRAGEVTRELQAAARGDSSAEGRLWELVYDELRAIAGRLVRAEAVAHALQPTAIVNEAALQLFGERRPDVVNRRHFLAVAANAMRHVLVAHARNRGAEKRGGAWQRVTLSEGTASDETDVDVLALHEALERLAGLSERPARVVELRYFGGLTLEETADHLGVSRSTVRDDWTSARAWLFRELRTGGAAASGPPA